MKKKDWYIGMSLADDRYVAEADPNNRIKSGLSRAFVTLVAACACLALVVCNLWLFIPFNTTAPDVSRYEGSDYYTVIEKLNELTFEKPKYKNNASKLWAALTELPKFGAVGGMDMAPGDPENAPADDGMEGATGTGDYKEITDNQVEGIIEADRIKRSDTHIYYLDGDTLRVFSIDKENTKEVGSYKLYDGESNYYLGQWEFYLSDDCNTVTLVTQFYSSKDGTSDRFVSLIALDVSDPEHIVKKDEFTVTGSYMSSRLTGGSILLLTEFAIDLNKLDFSDETTFLPQINEGEGAYSIPAEGIVAPDELLSTRYTVVMKLDEDTLELEGTAAYLSYSEDVYVSEDHVFLTRVFADKTENDDGTVTRNSMTEISCLSYSGDSFERLGSATVRGYVKDQWSMDEYEGILRVVTTTNATTINENHYGASSPSVDVLVTATGRSNASLYCIDLTSFEIVASVIDFAPPYEEVQSVRFDKETAYVCTSIEMSDPVFFFDLSNLEDITYKDTGTIEGFSTSLINIGGGFLVGIGRGQSLFNSFKVEVYEETVDGVRSVCSYELENTSYSTEYKSYYVDRENQLIGIGIVRGTYRDTDGQLSVSPRYILLQFDGYELLELVNLPLAGNPENMRGVYIDGYMYMFGSSDFKVAKVFG